MVHVGVDLDKRNSQIAILTEDGELVQQRIANDAVELEKFFAQLPPQSPIPIEASGTWWWLVDLREHLGHRPVLSHPSRRRPSPPLASRTTASTPSGGRSCAGATCCPPSGFRRRRCGRRANSFGTASSSSGCAAWWAIACRPCSPGGTCSRRRGRAGSRSAASGS